MSDNHLRPQPSSAQPITGSRARRSESLVSRSPTRAVVTARLASPVKGSPSGSQTTSSQSRYDSGEQLAGPLAGASPISFQGPGTSSLSQAIRSSFHETSQTPITQHARGWASARVGSPERPSTYHESSLSQSYSDQTAKIQRGGEDLEVLRRHLVGSSQTESPSVTYKKHGDLTAAETVSASAANHPAFSSLSLQGGDTTRDIYRYAEKHEHATAKPKRSMSMSAANSTESEAENIKTILMPQGFRRDHVRRTGASPAPSSLHGRHYGAIDRRSYTEPSRPNPQFVTTNFIEFLTLYGHFAGEELDEDDESLGPNEYFSYDADEAGDQSEDDQGQNSALLTPRRRKRRRRVRDAGKGSPLDAALLLLKSFVGTGSLFLPRAFYNGGMLFSLIILILLACLSYYCFILLVNTRSKVPASYGDMGGKIFGPYFRGLINQSLVLSQIGFTSAYMVFVAQNIQAFVLAVTRCRASIEIGWVIFAQMIFFLPISLYRNINNIQKLALLADVFICLGLVYLYYYDIKTIISRPGFADYVNFNASSWPLLIGTAIFTFEGVGLIIPIQSGMRDPSKFPKVLATVIVIIGILFISLGALSYAAYGSTTKTVIILNMPQDDKLVNAVQFLYSLAILFSIPLQIFPAIEITSQQLFSRTGKYSRWIKWKKNCFRFFMVVLCAGVAWAGAGDLDKFVSIVGSFACIPLVYIYPVSRFSMSI